MTQEEFETKVQSIPQQLRESFRQSLEMSLSSKIVNKFMNVAMSAYAQGQWDAQMESHDGAYMRGAEDMLEALKTTLAMDTFEVSEYFGIEFTDASSLRLIKILKGNANDILDAVAKYQMSKAQEKDEHEKASVKAMADEIGIEKLCEIAEGIRREKAEESGLPF